MATTKSPFKDNALLKQQIGHFLTKHGARFAQEAKRTSAFFELAAYNDLVKYYETNGYSVSPKNLRGPTNEFIYALSPNAKPQKCSFFLAQKKYKNGKSWSFEIRHNIRLQSAHDKEIFVTPDYSVIDQNTIASTKFAHHYNGKVDYYYVSARDVRTFAESKHYLPSPELVINFVGLVNEIKPKFIRGRFPAKRPRHCAPSLFVSGVGNVHLGKIKASLASRYKINVFLGLFAYPSQVHSSKNQANIQKIGTS